MVALYIIIGMLVLLDLLCIALTAASYWAHIR